MTLRLLSLFLLVYYTLVLEYPLVFIVHITGNCKGALKSSSCGAYA